MRFTSTALPGVLLVHGDRAGGGEVSTTRLFSREAFSDAGVPLQVARVDITRSAARGTLRGLRVQLPPAAEIKVVRCIAGALWSVAVDLRPDSAAFRRWFGVELSAGNRIAAIVPRGCAHGFVSLADGTEALTLSSATHAPKVERGLRWDDPAIGIAWPVRPLQASLTNEDWPPLDTEAPELWAGARAFEGLL